MGEKTDLRDRIEEFLSADSSREVTEEGELLFDLRQTEFRLEEAHGKLLLHLWSEERNWVRRVTGIAEESPDRLVLKVERFGQKRPGRLTVAPPSRRMGPERDRHSARRAYSRFLRRLLQREFPPGRNRAVEYGHGWETVVLRFVHPRLSARKEPLVGCDGGKRGGGRGLGGRPFDVCADLV